MKFVWNKKFEQLTEDVENWRFKWEIVMWRKYMWKTLTDFKGMKKRQELPCYSIEYLRYWLSVTVKHFVRKNLNTSECAAIKME